MEDEARSCSMDFGCITPLYVYRMWNGAVPLDEIERAMAEIKFLGDEGYSERHLAVFLVYLLAEMGEYIVIVFNKILSNRICRSCWIFTLIVILNG